MDDLVGNLQNILSTPEGQAQLQNIASMLNMNGNQQSSGTQGTNTQSAQTNNNNGFDISKIMGMLNNNGNSNQQSDNANTNGGNNGFDLSNLMGMLNQNANAQNNQQQNNSNNSGGLDLSNIMGMLNQNSNQPNNQATQNNAGGGLDLSSLANMFSGMGNGNQNNGSAPIMPNIDINMILKLQQVFASMNVNDKNSQLLYALKPHFSDKRQQKVDQAISMMRLMSMLPALKESGIFAGL